MSLHPPIAPPVLNAILIPTTPGNSYSTDYSWWVCCNEQVGVLELQIKQYKVHFIPASFSASKNNKNTVKHSKIEMHELGAQINTHYSVFFSFCLFPFFFLLKSKGVKPTDSVFIPLEQDPCVVKVRRSPHEVILCVQVIFQVHRGFFTHPVLFC